MDMQYLKDYEEFKNDSNQYIKVLEEDVCRYRGYYEHQLLKKDILEKQLDDLKIENKHLSKANYTYLILLVLAVIYLVIPKIVNLF